MGDGLRDRGFKRLTRLEDALSLFLERVKTIRGTESLPVEAADGRVLSSGYRAPRSSPHYDRSAMDGYAVEAADTVGASPATPVRIPMERVEAVHTGSSVPPGRDAVVKIEDAEERGEHLLVDTAVPVGKNVGAAGEDVEEGSVLFEAGHRLRPSDLSLMRALGTGEVTLVERPLVSVVPTGEELVPPGEEPGRGEMVESNGLMMGLSVERWGGEPRYDRVLSDEPGRLGAALDGALRAGSDLVLFSGGSSVGRRDNLVEVLRGRGEVVVHGIALQPGKPTALCFVDDTPVIALPGYPAATAVALEAVVRPTLEKLAGFCGRRCSAWGVLSRKVHSSVGRRTYARVRLEDGEALPLRTTGAGVLSSVARADGYVVVDEDLEGIGAGEEVEVLLI
ncbi:MAG: hypothetical protein MAG715_00520 [Methanonatronarchaeales archaeon]|nr:hypothetical protein [Methanonatronarchaeales archaeon]